MIASPCINVCRMDPATGFCEGCLRTLDEIGGWAMANDDEKRAVLAAVECRRLRRGGTGHGEGGESGSDCGRGKR